jgi:putative methionine-R-sulfoxide reductase with GAF domain
MGSWYRMMENVRHYSILIDEVHTIDIENKYIQMKAFYKNLSICTIVLFIIGLIAAAYYIYTLPGNIANTLNIYEVSQIGQINSAFRGTALVVGLALGLGLLSVILLLIEKQNNVQYTYAADSIKENKNMLTSQETTDEDAVKQCLQVIENSLQGNFSDEKSKLDYALKSICHEIEACQGVFFMAKQQDNKRIIELFASYAFYFAESKLLTYEFGEGLAGQVAKEGKLVNIKSVPEGYVTILSGLGSSSPNYLIISPVKQDNEVLGVLEIASFKEFSKKDEYLLNEFADLLGQQLSGKKKQQGDIRRIAYS